MPAKGCVAGGGKLEPQKVRCGGVLRQKEQKVVDRERAEYDAIYGTREWKKLVARNPKTITPPPPLTVAQEGLPVRDTSRGPCLKYACKRPDRCQAYLA